MSAEDDDAIDELFARLMVLGDEGQQYVVVTADPVSFERKAYGPFDGMEAWLAATVLTKRYQKLNMPDVAVMLAPLKAQVDE